MQIQRLRDSTIAFTFVVINCAEVLFYERLV
jgi:hypothetical protein